MRFWPAQLVEARARRGRQPRAECDAGAAIPGAQQRAAKALTLALGDDERVRAPRAGQLLAGDDHAHRHQRRRGDQRRAFAHDPIRRLDARRRIAARPIPMQPQALSGFIATRAPVKLLDTSSIVWSEAFDVRQNAVASIQYPVARTKVLNPATDFTGYSLATGYRLLISSWRTNHA